MRRLLLLPVAGLATVLLAGCGFSGLYGVTLPGGANVGAHPLTITADFTDALDLVPQSAVRVNDVPVGRVSSITLSPDGRTAEVKLLINGSVHLPANAVASIEQTSLLGEKYVALAAPSDEPATGALHDGEVIGVARTVAGIQAEQVLGALSLLLNGGGLAQLQTIDRELNLAAGGHEADFRELLTSLDQVVGQLNAHRSEITTALDQLDRLSATLASNDQKIANVLVNYSPGLQVLADERTQLIAMLDALNQLSHVSVATIQASQTDFVDDLHQLDPILSQLAAAGQALPDSLQVLLTYPFPDQALDAIKGDYLNTFITLDLHSTESELTTTLQPGLTANTESSRAATSPSGGSSPVPPSSPVSTAQTPSTPPPTLLPPTSSVLGVPTTTTPSAVGTASQTTSSGPATGSTSDAGGH
jgi:phospholipid/cholesterol/gamma-HCH transport system substrate-binding protein